MNTTMTPEPERMRNRTQGSPQPPVIRRSTLINFCAIALLFAVIFTLQQVSASLTHARPAQEDEPMAVIVDMEEIEAKAAREAKPAGETAVSLMPETSDAPTVAVRVLSAAEVRAAEQEAAIPPAAQPPVAKAAMAAEASAPGKAPAVAASDASTQAESPAVLKETVAETATPSRPREVKVAKRTRRANADRTASRNRSSDPYWQDKQLSVEELDNPHAREHYRALNQNLYAGAVQTPMNAPAPAAGLHSPAPERAGATQAAFVEDLDGTAARQRYRAETESLLGTNAGY